MVDVLSRLVRPTMVQPLAEPVNFHRCKNKEQSLMSLFWTIHNKLNGGERMMLVMDDQEHLEKLNYLISRYQLSALTLIASDAGQYDAHRLQTKFADDLAFRTKAEESYSECTSAKQKLSDSLNSSTRAVNNLHRKKLFPKSVVQINDLLTINKKGRIDTSEKILKPPYSYLDYQAKKETYTKAEKIYQPNFKFLKEENPFKLSALLDTEKDSLGVLLKDLVAKAKAILLRFDELEEAVQRRIDAKYATQLKTIKKDIDTVSTMLSSSTNLTDTEIKKQLFHQKNLFESLEINVDPPTEASQLDEGLMRIEEAADHKLENHFSKIQNELKLYLEQMTPSNSDNADLKDLIEQTNKFSAELVDLNLFENLQQKRSVTLAFQKANLQELVTKLSHGIYFLGEQEEYIAWLIFEEQITEEDKKIIGYLSEQEGFWGQNFENLFLQYFLNHTKSSLDSYVDQSTELGENLERYQKLQCAEVYQAHNAAPMDVDFRKSSSWAHFVEEQGNALTSTYPLLIVTKDFYNAHEDKLSGTLEHFIFWNDVPDTVIDEDWLHYSSFGYNAMYTAQLEKKAIKATPLEDDAIYFNVNRNLNQLNLSDATRCARYLSQELEQQGNGYRIFQSRNTAIISLWDASKNARLVAALADYGLKEIVNSAVRVNLIPGLLVDKEIKTFLLIEDELLGWSEDIQLVPQLQLLAEIRTAGITVLSLDNYKMIMDENAPFDKIIDQLKVAHQISESVAH